MSIIKAEPALLMGAIQATIVLVTAFGLQLTTEQVAAIVLFSGAVLSIATRQMVTPNAKSEANVKAAVADAVFGPGNAAVAVEAAKP